MNDNHGLPESFQKYAEKLVGKGVLITGGSGFVGQHLCQRFRRAGFKVSFTHHPRRSAICKGPLEGCTALPMDLEDPSSIRSAISAVTNPFCAVIHTAGVRFARYELEPSTSYFINVLGTKTLLDELDKACGKDNYCFLFISTDIVYADAKEKLLQENISELNPKSIYAKHKVDVEMMLKSRVKNYCIFRGPFIYGFPADHPNSTLTRSPFFLDLFGKLEKGDSFKLFIDEWRTPCFIGDCLDIIMRAMLKFSADPLASGSRIFNLTSGQTLTRFEFGKAVCEVFGFDTLLLRPIKLSCTNMEVLGARREVVQYIMLDNTVVKEELLVEGHKVSEALCKLACMQNLNESQCM